MRLPRALRQASSRHSAELRLMTFFLRLAALSLPLYLVLWLSVDLYPLQLAAAGQAGWILSQAGREYVQDGTGLIMDNGFRFYIIPDCTGWKGMLFFFALVFAVPGAPLKRRLIGLALGIPVIWTANVMRIAGVVSSQAAWGTDVAMQLHDVLFQAGLVALVIGLWSLWFLWARGRLGISLPWHQK